MKAEYVILYVAYGKRLSFNIYMRRIFRDFFKEGVLTLPLCIPPNREDALADILHGRGSEVYPQHRRGRAYALRGIVCAAVEHTLVVAAHRYGHNSAYAVLC